jgi:serine/threonine-protein kinase RsbW
MEQVRQEFSSELRHLAAVRTLVRDVCRRGWGPGADAHALAQLELAVDEAVANIVLHAYKGEAGMPLEVAVAADAESVCVTLGHRGEPFDPAAVAPPSFDGSREGGFGLYVIKQAVDELSFFQDERGVHVIRLVKKRNRG